MNIENVFPHTLAKSSFLFFFFFVIKMKREIASVIRKMHLKSSKDVSGTLLRDQTCICKVLLQISILRN